MGKVAHSLSQTGVFAALIALWSVLSLIPQPSGTRRTAGRTLLFIFLCPAVRTCLTANGRITS